MNLHLQEASAFSAVGGVANGGDEGQVLIPAPPELGRQLSPLTPPVNATTTTTTTTITTSAPAISNNSVGDDATEGAVGVLAGIARKSRSPTPPPGAKGEGSAVGGLLGSLGKASNPEDANGDGGGLVAITLGDNVAEKAKNSLAEFVSPTISSMLTQQQLDEGGGEGDDENAKGGGNGGGLDFDAALLMDFVGGGGS